MAKVKNNKKVERNYALPGEPMNFEEFENMVKEAEAGPFYPASVLKKDFEKWQKRKLKK